MKVLILGGSGMLGHRMAKVLEELDPIVPRRDEFNAPESIAKFGLADGDWVINCIGAIPQKNKSADEMQRINADFPRLLAFEGNYRFIQIATDCVYSGKTGNYTELANKDAEDVYGYTKKLGEPANFMNLRCSIVGAELTSKKSLFEWVANQPKGATINGFINHFWNGITTDAFARIVLGIIQNDFWLRRTQHIVPYDVVSKYELIKMMAERLGRDDLEIMPTITEGVDRTLRTIYPEANRKLWQLGGYGLPTIQELISEIEVN